MTKTLTKKVNRKHLHVVTEKDTTETLNQRTIESLTEMQHHTTVKLISDPEFLEITREIDARSPPGMAQAVFNALMMEVTEECNLSLNFSFSFVKELFITTYNKFKTVGETKYLKMTRSDSCGQ